MQTTLRAIATLAVLVVGSHGQAPPCGPNVWQTWLCDRVVASSPSACSDPATAQNCESSCCPTDTPTQSPTSSPTSFPTSIPTQLPSMTPTSSHPTETPTKQPTTSVPTNFPTSSNPTRSPTISPTLSPTELVTASPTAETCRQPSDIIFLVEESSVVTDAEFSSVQKFMRDLLFRFEVGRKLETGSFSGSTSSHTGDWQTRVGMITYSGWTTRGWYDPSREPPPGWSHPDQHTKIQFDLNEFVDYDSLVTRVNSITKQGGTVWADEGFQRVLDLTGTDEASYPTLNNNSLRVVPRILIVIQKDGYDNGHSPLSIATRLRGSEGHFTTIINILITDETDTQRRNRLITDMTRISGFVSQTFVYNSYSDLESLDAVKDIRSATCQQVSCGSDTSDICLRVDQISPDYEWTGGELPSCWVGPYSAQFRRSCSSTCCRVEFTQPTVSPTTTECSTDDASTPACQASFLRYWNDNGGSSDPCSDHELATMCKKSCCEILSPTASPTKLPTPPPSMAPTSAVPTVVPTMEPTLSTPTISPTTSPTRSNPTRSPTRDPTTPVPSLSPTFQPSRSPTTYTCPNDLDLMFLIDESTTVRDTPDLWETYINFTKSVAYRFQVGRATHCGVHHLNACTPGVTWRTKVSVSTFSSSILRENGMVAGAFEHIDFENTSTYDQFVEAIDKIRPAGGRTLPNVGIEHIKNYVVNSAADRPNIPNVLIVLTDSEFDASPAEAARNLRGAYTQIVAIGNNRPESNLSRTNLIDTLTNSISGTIDNTFVQTAENLVDVLANPVTEQCCRFAECGIDIHDDCDIIVGFDRIGCYDSATAASCAATCCNHDLRSTTTVSPTASPTASPSSLPTKSPSSSLPTRHPSANPTMMPTTEACGSDNATYDACQRTIHHFLGMGLDACQEPEVNRLCRRSCCLYHPPTEAPTAIPTNSPTHAPSSSAPSVHPTLTPSTSTPTRTPTQLPTSSFPTVSPTISPTSNRPTSRPTSYPTTSPSIYRCESDLDLMFLLDESTSTQDDQAFIAMKHTVLKITERFTVGRQRVCGLDTNACGFNGRNRTRVSVSTFSSPSLRPNGMIQSAYTHIQLGDHDNWQDFTDSLDRISATRGATLTDFGLHEVQQEVIPHTRPLSEGIPRVLIVMSDTETTPEHDPTSVASSIVRDNHTSILGVAVGYTQGLPTPAAVRSLDDIATQMAMTISVSLPPAGLLDRTWTLEVPPDDYNRIVQSGVAEQSCSIATCGVNVLATEDCHGFLGIDESTPRNDPSFNPFQKCNDPVPGGIAGTLIKDVCAASCCLGYTSNPTSAPSDVPTSMPTFMPTSLPTSLPTSEGTTTTTSPEPNPSINQGDLSSDCVDKEDTIAGVCDASLCCDTSDPMLAGLVAENCQATCCNVVCPAIVDISTTGNPETADASQDRCGMITCADECTGDCGWSSKRNACKLGARTTTSELGSGDCSVASTQSPEDIEKAARRQCAAIRCAADCSGDCGWSERKMKCVLGGRTTKSELNMGQC